MMEAFGENQQIPNKYVVPVLFGEIGMVLIDFDKRLEFIEERVNSQ